MDANGADRLAQTKSDDGYVYTFLPKDILSCNFVADL